MNEYEFNKYVMNTYKRYPISFEPGEGAYLFDDKGNKYLDFVSGIAVNALGYKNKNFIDSITKQLNKINHSSNLFYVEPQGVLAKKISEFLNYPLEDDIGYPTPGSMGTYFGVEKNIPLITIECDENEEKENLYIKFEKLFKFMKIE